MTARDRKDGSTMSRFTRLAAVSALALAAGACTTQPQALSAAHNFSLNSVHQPIVEHTNFVFDAASGRDGLSSVEQDRLAAWFGSIDVRYGDRVSIDEPRGYESPRARADVARVAAQFGLLLDGAAAPVTEGELRPGTIRIVAGRASAHVDGCPEWSDPGIESQVRTSTNYGCSVNSNFAAMVANPDDLVHGREGSGRDSAMVAGRAIRVFRERQPSGHDPLPTTTTTRSGQ
jgi:pilus assembly protein CpaD